MFSFLGSGGLVPSGVLSVVFEVDLVLRQLPSVTLARAWFNEGKLMVLQIENMEGNKTYCFIYFVKLLFYIS